MKALIQGQTIRIDDHKRGDRSETKWSKELHLHKVFNSDRYSGAEVLIPLNSERDLDFRKVKGSEKQKVQILNEIRRAFKNEQTRNSFTEDLLGQIERFSLNAPPAEQVRNLINGIGGIAKHFELNSNHLVKIKRNMFNKVETILTKHRDEEFNEYFILQNLEDNSILIGEDLEIIREWKDIMKRFDSKD